MESSSTEACARGPPDPWERQEKRSPAFCAESLLSPGDSLNLLDVFVRLVNSPGSRDTQWPPLLSSSKAARCQTLLETAARPVRFLWGGTQGAHQGSLSLVGSGG